MPFLPIPIKHLIIKFGLNSLRVAVSNIFEYVEVDGKLLASQWFGNAKEPRM
jgi:hypothetical protein